MSKTLNENQNPKSSVSKMKTPRKLSSTKRSDACNS